MKATDLTAEQRQALLDLLILGMYADRKLASAEDACVQKLLASFSFTSDFERDSFADAAFTRTTRHVSSPEAVRAYVEDLAPRFQPTELRQNVYDRLNELLTSDGRVTTEENQLLQAVKAAFRL